MVGVSLCTSSSTRSSPSNTNLDKNVNSRGKYVNQGR